MIDIHKLTAAEYDALVQALDQYVANMEDYEHMCDGQIDARERERLVTATRLRDELDAVHAALASDAQPTAAAGDWATLQERAGNAWRARQRSAADDRRRRARRPK